MRHKLLALLLFMSTPAWAQDKTAHIIGPILPGMEFKVLKEVSDEFALPGPQTFVINSPGGYCETGDRLIQIIEALHARNVPVVCIVDGEASSMAFNFLTHCDVRLATAKSKFLIHRVRQYNWDTHTPVTIKNLRDAANDLEKSDLPYGEPNAAALGLDFKVYNALADQEKSWSTKRLIELGYLNGIVEKLENK